MGAGVHMFVLVHGLGGTPGHMQYLAQRLQEEWRVSLQEKEDDLLILNAECNNTGWKWFSGIPNWWATSDGIDQGGERLAQEIIARVNLHCAEVARRKELCGREQDGCVVPLKELTKLSVIGSSMGGLYVRYALGKLYDAKEENVFIPHISTTPEAEKEEGGVFLELVNFVSLVTPHLGARGLLGSLTHVAVRCVYYRGTGAQLFLDDLHPFSDFVKREVSAQSEEEKGAKDDEGDAEGLPLLVWMADEELPFLRSLASFKRRILFCGTPRNESRVPYASSAIVDWPFYPDQNDKSGEEGEDGAKQEYIVGEHNDDTPSGSSPAYPHEGSISRYYDAEEEEVKRHIERMIGGLRTLTWHRVDINLLHPQAAVLNKSREELVVKLFSLLNREA